MQPVGRATTFWSPCKFNDAIRALRDYDLKPTRLQPPSASTRIEKHSADMSADFIWDNSLAIEFEKIKKDQITNHFQHAFHIGHKVRSVSIAARQRKHLYSPHCAEISGIFV